MRRSIALGIALAVLALVSLPRGARADEGEQERHERSPVLGEWSTEPLFVPSPESLTLELRVGAYRPDLGPAFERAFHGDLGPLVALELDYHLVRIPYLGPLQFGARVGWVEWTGDAVSSTGQTNVGSTGMSLVPLSALVSLRIDALSRYLSFPLIFTPKLGLDFGYFQTGTSGVTQADGWSIGVDWGLQLALELDFLEPRAARRLDEEWGINHSEIFFELFGSTMGSFSDRQLPLGSSLAWAAGLGLTF